jgi:hypothetical protein
LLAIPFSNSPSAISYQPFIFPLQQSPSSTFPSKASHIQKAKSPKTKSKSKEQQPRVLLQSVFYISGKQGSGAIPLGEERDIVIRGTCNTSLNINYLEKAAEFIICFPQISLRKTRSRKRN